MADTSSLLLKNDILNDFVGSRRRHHPGRRPCDGSGCGGATLELQATTIDGGDHRQLPHRRPAQGRQQHHHQRHRELRRRGRHLQQRRQDRGGRHQQPDAEERHPERFRRATRGTIQVDGAADGSGAGGATLELQATTIDGGDHGSFHIDGLLKVDNNTTDQRHRELRRRGRQLQQRRQDRGGRHQQPAAEERHPERFRRIDGGTIQVDGAADGSGCGGATLELQATTIDGGDHGSFHIDGLLKADNNTTTNVIENFDAAAGSFSNDGKIEVADTSSLLLKNDILNDFVGSVAAAPSRSTALPTAAAAAAPRSSCRPAPSTAATIGSFHIDGLLKVDNNATTNVIENFDAAAGSFSNDGKIEVADTSSLLLKNDILNDFVGSVAAAPSRSTALADGSGSVGATLELQATTIDGGDHGSFHIDGLLKVDNNTTTNSSRTSTPRPAPSATTARSRWPTPAACC